MADGRSRTSSLSTALSATGGVLLAVAPLCNLAGVSMTTHPASPEAIIRVRSLLTTALCGTTGFGVLLLLIGVVLTIGAAILGFATSSWLAYREAAWDNVKIVVQMEIVWTILGTLVALWGLLFAGFPTADWMNVVIFGGFTATFSYFYFRGSTL